MVLQVQTPQMNFTVAKLKL